MQIPLFLRRLAVLLMVAAPAAVMAAPNDRDAPLPAESRKEAYADCGGPPIQDGRDIQPTPAHDECLAKKQKINRRKQTGNPPQADDNKPVVPPADVQPVPK